MIAAAATNPAPANPAVLADGQVAAAEQNPQPAAETAAKTNSPAPVADGQVAPAPTETTPPGSTPEDTAKTATPAPAPSTEKPSDTTTAGVRDRIEDLTAQINDLTNQDSLSEMDQLKLQELSQARTQLITMLTNLMQQEHEARMAIIRNL